MELPRMDMLINYLCVPIPGCWRRLDWMSSVSLLQTVIHFNGEMIPDTCSPSSPHLSWQSPSEGTAGHRAHCPQSGGRMSQASHWSLHTDEQLSLLQDFTLGCCSPRTVYGHAPPLPSFPCPPSHHHVEPSCSRKV